MLLGIFQIQHVQALIREKKKIASLVMHGSHIMAFGKTKVLQIDEQLQVTVLLANWNISVLGDFACPKGIFYYKIMHCECMQLPAVPLNDTFCLQYVKGSEMKPQWISKQPFALDITNDVKKATALTFTNGVSAFNTQMFLPGMKAAKNFMRGNEIVMSKRAECGYGQTLGVQGLIRV